MVHYPTLKKLIDEAEGSEEVLMGLIAKNVDNLIVKHILIDDVIATVNYLIGLRYEIGSVDNIDHLANRRVRSVGELLQNQFRIGIARLERVIRERMQIQSDAELTPQTSSISVPCQVRLKSSSVPASCLSLWTRQIP